MDQASIVAKIVKECLQGPDFSDLKEELRNHEFVNLIPANRNPSKFTKWFKILFVCENSVIVQEVELTYGETRFVTQRIWFSDWAGMFDSWVTTRRECLKYCWADGYEMYLDEYQ